MENRFDKIYKEIRLQWNVWHKNAGSPQKYIVGISGGVDSSVVVALACCIFGKDNVIGVSLPRDGQNDMWAVDALFNYLGIKRVTIDIGDAFNSIINGIENNAIDMSDDCRINLPARLRMSTLFAVAQCVGGMVLNTCNLSEDIVGYSTFGGDNFGCYAPIKNLTKTEVIALGKILGLPKDLVEKTPIDGLQPLSDEEKLGFTYAKLDDFIRLNDINDLDFADKIKKLFEKNKFKLDIVKIPGPEFNFLPCVLQCKWFNENTHA